MKQTAIQIKKAEIILILLFVILYVFIPIQTKAAVIAEEVINEQKSEEGKEEEENRSVTGLVLREDGYVLYIGGKQITKKGWQEIFNEKFHVSSDGYVTSKMEKTKEIWRFYKYDDQAGKWEKQKDVWNSVDGRKYYFSKSGNSTRIYDTKTKKCYDHENGKMVLAKRDVREICGKEFYFGADGVKVSLEGLYFTASGKLIYAKSNGRVTKEISGQVLEFTVSGGKIINCRMKDSHYMCYYNGSGDLRRRIDLNQAMVALTYDDGPSIYTPTILDTLNQYNSVATFFVVGNRVYDYPSTIISTYDMGCEIGNHTYNHTTLTRVEINEIQSQVSSTNIAVNNVIGVSPVVMRPPGGGYNDTVKSVVGMPIIMWSIDTLDWNTRNTSSTQSAVLEHVRDGDIVLMHDLYSETAEASKVIIPELINRGYQLVTVSELSHCRDIMSSGTVYNSFR